MGGQCPSCPPGTCTTCILKFRMDMLRFNWVVTVDLLLLVLLEIKLPDIAYLVMQ